MERGTTRRAHTALSKTKTVAGRHHAATIVALFKAFGGALISAKNQKQTELGKGLVMAWRHLNATRGPAIEGSAAEAARAGPIHERDKKPS